ncbi:hypothetical protein FSP39_014321 [Pinctada imbricata]|uniref:Protein kinase domain-containing protein n=1 Tax=Pinctada imbricata TaxID=66713 RepID=A0AA88XSA1_PINIB|nr:hypothetical protein FSP39_014321 [Pinctada imbricata]
MDATVITQQEDLANLRNVPKSPRCSTSENLLNLNIKEHYEIIKELGRGTYGKVVLGRCKETGTQVALKVLPKTNVKLREFQREFDLSYFLSPHSNIVDTYNVAFETKSSFVFAQEFAPVGDLFDKITPQQGMSEKDAKCVIRQIASALDFMHSKKLVHRDIKPENVLIFDHEFSKVKLMDFGMTRKDGTVIRKVNGSIPYTPPEICEAVRNESITVSTSCDIWAFGVLLFCMLTGNFPWENADISDVYYNEFTLWQRRKSTKLPSQWKKFTPRLMRLFRKILDPKGERRCEIKEICKYLNDSWIQPCKNSDNEEEDMASGSDHMDELSNILQNHGIETHMDKACARTQNIGMVTVIIAYIIILHYSLFPFHLINSHKLYTNRKMLT